METKSAPWLEAAEKIEPWLADPRLSEDYLRFRINLARAYAAAQAALETSPAVAPGVGALSASDVNFDARVIGELFSAVMGGLKGGASEALSGVIERIVQEPGFLPLVARLSVFATGGDELKSLADETGISEVELLALGRLLAVPFVMAAVQHRPPTDPVAPGETACPACGSAPLLARLRMEDGKRRLVCSLCLTEWSFPRIMCPGCGNTASDGLTIISLPESDARWIEVCDKCRSYIKTVDERKLPAGGTLPYVEESITLPLDLLAEREGYHRS